jgi:hypothetical protein
VAAGADRARLAAFAERHDRMYALPVACLGRRLDERVGAVVADKQRPLAGPSLTANAFSLCGP